MTTITGPWAKPEQRTITEAQRRDIITAALWLKRSIRRAWQIRDAARDKRTLIRRCTIEAKASADLDWLRTLKEQANQIDASITELTTIIQQVADGLLSALSTLDPHLDAQQAGALLGIDHRHVERAGGLLHAATAQPTSDAIWIPVWHRMIQTMMDEPVLHRRTTATMNDMFGFDFPLPAVPRPRAI